MLYYHPKHFKPYELVPKGLYESKKHKGDGYFWMLWKPEVLYTIDKIRERYGATTVNDWFWGGSYDERGFRESNTKEGASRSQHKYFNAIDSKSKDATAFEIRADILKDPWHEDFKYITCIEVGPTITWLHFDCRNWDKINEGILQVTL